MDEECLKALKLLTVLYVEDDQETSEELEMMIKPWVAALHVAADGQAGLDLFKAKRPDVVLTDIQMPRVNGLAMSADIRKLVPDQIIIVLSAFNDAEYLFRAIELGIDQYLPKPVNVDRLIDKLAQMATTQLALRERQRNQLLLEQYKHLVDQSAIVCKLAPSGLITYVNDKLCDVSGFTAQELIGQDISVLRANGESSAGLQEAKAGRHWAGIIRNHTRNGRTYVSESSLVPILNEDGKVAEIVCMDVDITSVFDSHDSLREALAKSNLSLLEQRHFLGEYKRALELGTCVCVTDRSLRIVSFNKQFEILLGFTAHELLGKPFDQIGANIPKTEWFSDIEQADHGKFATRVVRLRAKMGEELQLSVGCVAVHNLTGEIDSVILICQDITESLRRSRDIAEAQRELLYVMGSAVESRSKETGQHVRRIAAVARFLALKAGLNGEAADMIETAAPMHDVGKVGISDHILNKPGKLLPEEFEEMKQHASIGQSILGAVDRPLIKLAASIAQEHHERWDGTGYPVGLAGKDISIAGRIVAIADVLDALCTERIYKPAWGEQQVLDYFRDQRGRQFDPHLVDLLLIHWDTIHALRGDASTTIS
jgi:PAS domain S-box-containing protein